jgi:hypothetical protein
MSLPEWLASFTLGLFARDADIQQQPIVQIQQCLPLSPAIMHSLSERQPAEGGRHVYVELCGKLGDDGVR